MDTRLYVVVSTVLIKI